MEKSADDMTPANVTVTRSLVDLSGCDREPIHIPSAILPHGAMLVLDRDTLEILQAAGDLAGLTGAAAAELLGTTADRLWKPDQIAHLRSICSSSDLLTPRHLFDPALRVLAHQPVDASIHVADGVLVVEFEAANSDVPYKNDALETLESMFEGLRRQDSLQALCQLAVEHVRRIAGYERVMVLRLTEDGALVFAESREPQTTAFLGMYYPSTDIPAQARALYLKTWLRLIKQVDYEPAMLTPVLNPRTGRPLDMSQATLRDVSPIHREYLRNMGVNASMSISIISEGKLWGLISCHHSKPLRLARHLRVVCVNFGMTFSLQLEARERVDRLEESHRGRAVLQSLVQDLSAAESYDRGLMRNLPGFLDLIVPGGPSLDLAKHGVAVCFNDVISSHGVTPSAAQIAALTSWLANRMIESGEVVFDTDCIGDLWQPANAFADVASGVLAILVAREPLNFVLWFRPEIVVTRIWGGDPVKQATPDALGQRLTPRKSFDAWTQIVRGHCLAWRQSDRATALELRVALLEEALRRTDAETAAERERARHSERLLMGELDHRVKNTLANILALMTLAGQNATSVEEFIESIRRRIFSMSKAHNLLTAGRWEGVSIRDLLREELEPYDNAVNTSVEGPHVVLAPKPALALSMAIHELATNAAKYGAFSTPDGKVQVRWTCTATNDIQLTWKEFEGPEVRFPFRRGFGSMLIEQVLGFESDGRATLHFESGGVRCEITLPAAAIAIEESIVGRYLQPSKPTAATPPALGDIGAPNSRRRRVLVVEDSAMVAMLLRIMIASIGWDMVGPAHGLEQACAMARAEPLDAAILDVDLRGEMSWEVAELLKARDIPFLFGTGYGRDAPLPPNLHGSEIVEKPFDMDELKSRLLALVAARDDLGTSEGP